MNNKYTLKELADMFAYERTRALKNCQSVKEARLLALRHVLDTIGYEFPKDAEHEAFYTWWKANRIAYCNEEHAFQLWKAGREELRKEVCSDQCRDTKTEPDWIPWGGGDKSPIPGKQTRYEVEYRDGAKAICVQNTLRWAHTGTAGDIIAYRVLDEQGI